MHDLYITSLVPDILSNQMTANPPFEPTKFEDLTFDWPIPNTPFVSVILPIRNEARYIARCLNAILAQDYPSSHMEILVADGMSTDDTRNIVLQLSKKNPDHIVVLIDNLEGIFSTGFNTAVCHARGEIILMMGGHTELAVDYISVVAKYLQNQEVDCVGGALETIASDSVGNVIALAMGSSFGVGGVAFRTSISSKLEEVDTVAFGSYRRDVLKQCGLLDEEMVHNQDDEFNYRIRDQGFRISLAPNLFVKYYSRTSLSALWRQYYQYGFWKVRVLQKHPRQMSLRQFVPPTFVLALLGSVFLALSPILRPLSLIVPSFYFLANLTASIWTVIKKARTAHYSLLSALYSLFLLSLIFAILHLSYGLGFLAGLVKFSNRWGDKIGKTPVWVSVKKG